MTEPVVDRITRIDLTVEPWDWPFARARRAEIDAHFAHLQVDRPGLWNGRVLLQRRPGIVNGIFSAACFETDFASFIAWRDWNFPDANVFNAFGIGALRGSDGAFVLGEMAAHTANAGQIYFAAGTPDPDDVADGDRVDIAHNIAREVFEETGLAAEDYVARKNWTCVRVGPRISLARTLDVPAPAEAIKARIENFLRQQASPELCGIHIVRGPHDLTSAMPRYVTAFMEAEWANMKGSLA